MTSPLMASATHTALESTAMGDDSSTVPSPRSRPVAGRVVPTFLRATTPILVGCSDEVRVAFKSTANVSSVAPTNVESGAGLVVATGAAVVGATVGATVAGLVSGPASDSSSHPERCSSTGIRRALGEDECGHDAAGDQHDCRGLPPGAP